MNEENLKKSQTNRFYPVDDEACMILKEKNVVDFLRWSNMLVNIDDREKICGYISQFITDVKKLKKQEKNTWTG